MGTITSTLTGDQKNHISSHIIQGNAITDEDVNIIFLKGEKKNKRTVPGVKKIIVQEDPDTEVMNILEPEVFITPYRMTAIGEFEYSDFPGIISFVKTVANFGQGRLLSIWFDYSTDERIILRDKSPILNKDINYIRYSVLPAKRDYLKTPLWTKNNITLMVQLTDTNNKVKNIRYTFKFDKTVDTEPVHKMFLKYQQNCKTMTLGRAYKYYKQNADIAKALESLK